MKTTEQIIKQLIARRFKYGGNSFQVHVRRIVRAVELETDSSFSYGERAHVVNMVIEQLEDLGGQYWGRGYRNSMRQGHKYNSNISRIYQIKG